MTIKDIDEIIRVVQELRIPKVARLKLTGGVMADGYVCACDDILARLKELKSELET